MLQVYYIESIGIAVAYAQEQRCRRTSKTADVRQHLTLVAPSGYIANVVTDETGCGASGVPWRILAKAGQRINVTLHDFRPSVDERDCYLYATIGDTRGAAHKVCRGGARIRHVFTSNTNCVDLAVTRHTGADDEERAYFMFQYECECDAIRFTARYRITQASATDQSCQSLLIISILSIDFGRT